MAKKKAEDLVPVFIPALGAVLVRAEDMKGSPLSEAEVGVIRDDAACMMMERAHAAKLDEKRGYPDVDPENCWYDFQALRKQLGRKPDLDGGAKVMLFKSNDPEMEKAIATAQATLDDFRHLLQRADPTAMPMVKTSVGEGEARVFLWLSAAHPTPSGFSAVAYELPPAVKTLTKGQRVEVASKAVIDWMLNDRGIAHGGFSLRLHRSRLPEERRAAFDQQIGVTRFV